MLEHVQWQYKLAELATPDYPEEVTHDNWIAFADDELDAIRRWQQDELKRDPGSPVHMRVDIREVVVAPTPWQQAQTECDFLYSEIRRVQAALTKDQIRTDPALQYLRQRCKDNHERRIDLLMVGVADPYVKPLPPLEGAGDADQLS